MADTEPPGDDNVPDPAGPDHPVEPAAESEPAEQPDWWASTEQSSFAKLGTTAARPSFVTSSPSSGTEISGSSPARSVRIGGTMVGWSLLLLAGAGGMIAGSLSTWVNVKSPFGSGHVTGVSDGDAGWITLIAAIVVAVVAVGIAVFGAESTPRRLLSLMAAGGAGAAFAIAIFALVQQPTGRGVSLGWGLILVLLGSIFALMVSFALNISDD